MNNPLRQENVNKKKELNLKSVFAIAGNSLYIGK
jgi:hypothetical protein